MARRGRSRVRATQTARRPRANDCRYNTTWLARSPVGHETFIILRKSRPSYTIQKYIGGELGDARGLHGTVGIEPGVHPVDHAEI